MIVSVFKNFHEVSENLALSIILNQIKDGKYMLKIGSLRELVDKGNYEEYNKEKKSLSSFTPSGMFNGRRKLEKLEVYTGCIILDIDKLNPTQLLEAKSKTIENPYTYSCFKSPSNNGLKILVKSDGKSESHKETFNQIKEIYESLLGIPIDPSGKDIPRLCFYSYDPDIYINEYSKVFEFKEKNEYKKTKKHEKEVENLISKIELAKLDVTSIYKDWLMIAFALSNEFGANGESYFHRISKFHPNYNYEACSKQFIACLASESKEKNTKHFISFINLKLKQSSISKRNENNEDLKIEDIVFYIPSYDREGELKDLKIDYTKWIDVLYGLGFRRFDTEKDFVFVRLIDQIIEEVSVTHIQDEFIRFLENFPENLEDGITKEFLIGKFYRNPSHYFCENRLNLLRPRESFIFNKDSKDDCLIYFKNGFVCCTKEGYQLKKYTDLKGLIWKNQIVEHDFEFLDFMQLTPSERGEFSVFVNNVSGKDAERYESLTTIIGYLLHSNFSGKLKAVVFTDSKISDVPSGRTGKTLVGQALGYIKKLTEINGKDFDPTNKHKYQEGNLDTQIIHLNDVKKNFDFENLFNDITEGIVVDKKNVKPYRIVVKIILSTNKTIKIEGDSARDRAIEFEFSEHYSEIFSPEDEFGHWFFRDWNDVEWMKFFNFLLFCISSYLKKGIIVAKTINLNSRKLIESTNQEFVEFMNTLVKDGEIKPNIEYDKKELFDKFMLDSPEYEDYKYFKQRRFTECLRAYAKYSGNFSAIDPNIHERKSGTIRYIKFPLI